MLNNAGYALVGTVEEASEADVRALFDTNFFGTLRVIQAALPLLRRIVAAGDAADYGVLTRPFPAGAQKAFAWQVAGEAFGLQPDFARQDESAHPFHTNHSDSCPELNHTQSFRHLNGGFHTKMS